MAVTVTEVVDAFRLLYDSIHMRKFRKTLKLNEFCERELCPLVRTFLLGYFGSSVAPEVACKLPGNLSGRGSIDFVISDVAVEFAVRTPHSPKSVLSAIVNTTEIKKLMMYSGRSLLVLYDFHKNHLEDEDIERFRDYPSLGKGNHKKSPFNVAYYYKRKARQLATDCIRKNIRVSG